MRANGAELSMKYQYGTWAKGVHTIYTSDRIFAIEGGGDVILIGLFCMFVGVALWAVQSGLPAQDTPQSRSLRLVHKSFIWIGVGLAIAGALVLLLD